MQSHDMCKINWVENSHDSISARTVKGVCGLRDREAKGSRYLDVHPLAELSVFTEAIQKALSCQSEYLGVFANHANKDLALHFCDVCRKALHDAFLRSFRSLLQYLVCILLKVPEFQMSVARRNKVLLIGFYI